MKPFTQVAVPHEDIVKGKLTMDVFAADLWQVVKGRAPLDYQDPDLFFKKTYMTKGLENILRVAKSRLEGKSGDAVIQLQTPFGGGKTHTLIALYHKAREWGAKVAVFDGTAFDPKEVRPWEEIERQLTGRVELTRGDTPPGKEKLIKLLSENAPVLILVDELLEYVTKAAGVKVGNTDLASQVSPFIQELTGAVSALGNVLLVLTLPSSILERYDENAERMFQQLQKIVGRTEKVYTPVDDEEIASVVRARLFSRVDEGEAKKIVDEFVEYAVGEGLLSRDDAVEYRERFLRSYPFKPEVIDILYKRWGSFPTFQRTRGLLRLLSLVVHDLLNEKVPFIRLGDFNLGNEEIRRELIKHMGHEWDGIVYQDITSKDAGAKEVDEGLGSSYRAYRLGTVVSTTIFMTSFSGKGEKEVSLRELKLYCAYPEFSSTVIDNAVNMLKDRLFYLSDHGLFFTNRPNLNRLLVMREESVPWNEVYEQEKEVLRKHVSKKPRFRVILHPEFSRDVPDTPELKLVVLDKDRPDVEFLENCGDVPRKYRNTVIFLCADDRQRDAFGMFLRKLLALRSLAEDRQLQLTDAQRDELLRKLKSYVQREYEELRKLYRKVYVPAKDGYKEVDLGLTTYGESFLDEEVYDILRGMGEILEKVSPMVIKEKYLADRDYVEIRKIYDAFLRTPGELRVASEDAFVRAVKEGVREGLFGYGVLHNGVPECLCIGGDPDVRLTEDEVIIKPELCVDEEGASSGEELDTGGGVLEGPTADRPSAGTVLRDTGGDGGVDESISSVELELKVPVGSVSTVAKVVNFLKSRFDVCEISVVIRAKGGRITVAEYEDKVKEAISQAGIRVEDEDVGRE